VNSENESVEKIFRLINIGGLVTDLVLTFHHYFREKDPHVYISMDATNLDFVSAHDLWGYQATVQHPISG